MASSMAPGCCVLWGGQDSVSCASGRRKGIACDTGRSLCMKASSHSRGWSQSFGSPECLVSLSLSLGCLLSVSTAQGLPAARVPWRPPLFLESSSSPWTSGVLIGQLPCGDPVRPGTGRAWLRPSSSWQGASWAPRKGPGVHGSTCMEALATGIILGKALELASSPLERSGH